MKKQNIIKICIAILLLAVLFIPSGVKAEMSNADMEKIVRDAVRSEGELTRSKITGLKDEVYGFMQENLRGFKFDLGTKLVMVGSSFLLALLVFSFIQFKVWIKQKKFERRLNEMDAPPSPPRKKK